MLDAVPLEMIFATSPLWGGVLFGFLGIYLDRPRAA